MIDWSSCTKLFATSRVLETPMVGGFGVVTVAAVDPGSGGGGVREVGWHVGNGDGTSISGVHSTFSPQRLFTAW